MSYYVIYNIIYKNIYIYIYIYIYIRSLIFTVIVSLWMNLCGVLSPRVVYIGYGPPYHTIYIYDPSVTVRCCLWHTDTGTKYISYLFALCSNITETTVTIFYSSLYIVVTDAMRWCGRGTNVSCGLLEFVVLPSMCERYWYRVKNANSE